MNKADRYFRRKLSRISFRLYRQRVRLRRGRLSPRREYSFAGVRKLAARLAAAILLSLMLISAREIIASKNTLPQNLPCSGTLTDGYGMRFSPKIAFHYGVDIADSPDTPIYSAGAGVIAEVGENSEFGKYVLIRHREELLSKYAHLNSVLVEAGVKVKAGELIGTMGESGNANGTHLHFEIIFRGNRVDPFDYLKIDKQNLL